MEHNEITPKLKEIIERYLGKHLPEGINATLRNTGYSDRIDFKVNMTDLVENKFNNINSNIKMTQFVQDLVRILNSLFQVNIMDYGFLISIIGEKEWIDGVFNKEIKQAFKKIPGSECIASMKVIRDVTSFEYDIVIGVKKDCKPEWCSWYEHNERIKCLGQLGQKLRETLDTFNLPDGMFTIKLGGRNVSPRYEF
jgi:hypothetical protein